MKTLPIIRHIRFLITWWRIERHYAMWASMGALPAYRHVDDEYLQAI